MQTLTLEGGSTQALLAECSSEGLDSDALALRLQREGAQAFSVSWQHLQQAIAAKAGSLVAAAP
jgi:transaldolase